MKLGHWQRQKLPGCKSGPILEEMHLGLLKLLIISNPRDGETLEPLQSNRPSSR